MIVVGLSILATTMSMARSEAHCHIFRVWRYPKPQHCFVALAPLPHHRTRSIRPETFHEQIDIAIPSLDFQACPEGNERMVGIARLHALYDAPPAGWR